VSYVAVTERKDMEKTWKVREEELREEIAKRIEHEIEMMMPPVDDVELSAYNTATWCVEVARGKHDTR
jgi:Tfp pilus assembly PilM family ATPase